MLKLNTKQLISTVEKQKALEHVLAEFKAKRDQLLEKAVVTTKIGNQYDADERSIIRMGNALLAMTNEPNDFEMNWSMADTETGVMTKTTKADLVEAHRLAVESMAEIWARI